MFQDGQVTFVLTRRRGNGDDISQVAVFASEGARRKIAEEIDGRIAELVATEARRDTVVLANFGEGLSGLEGGAKAYRELQEKYSTVLHESAVQALLDDIARRRSAGLQRAEDEIARVIGQQTSESALDGLNSRLLSVPSDRSDPVGARLVTLLESRKESLRADRLRAEAAQRQAEAERRNAEVARQMAVEQRADVPRQNAAPQALVVTGLINEQVIRAFHEGDFASIEFEREDPRFGAFLQAYLRTFGTRCRSALPPSKVEMFTQECGAESVTRNGWGVEISRSCARWDDVPTGIYADPDLYNTKRDLDRLLALDTLKQAARLLMSKNAIGDMMSLAGAGASITGDIEKLLTMNPCSSTAVRRFQDNLRLFALNKPAIQLNPSRTTSAAIMPIPGVPFRDQNYQRLLEDLVQDQSKNWLVNRFISGSVIDVTVYLRDSLGRPATVNADYAYTDMGVRRANGEVELRFTDGLPTCLYFADAPANCRTPNRRIVENYTAGKYEE